MRDNIIHLTGRLAALATVATVALSTAPAALATVATVALSTAPAAHAQRGDGGAEVNGRG